jgi:excinuclease ABC subunit C
MLLESVVRQRRSLSGLPDMRSDAAAAGVRELREHLKLDRPPRVIEAFDISTISGTHSVASLVCSVDGLPQRNRYRRFRIRSVEGMDDPAMMAEVIRRRFGRLRAENKEPPDLVLLDGGVTQLAAAQRELQALGFEHVATAALAKRFEEIFVSVGEPPLRLPRDSAALKVLQALRDEAHRFALAYHRRLRAWRIRESALDEVPGIGDVRKQKLLRHFGSVRRLLLASEEEMAKVPGIGLETARLIRSYLLGAEEAGAGESDTGERLLPDEPADDSIPVPPAGQEEPAEDPEI